MKKAVIIFVLICSCSIYAQQDSLQGAYTNTNTDLDIFIDPEITPAFPGGQNAMNKFLIAHIKYPPIARDAGIQGKVWASFIITKTGKVENIQIVRGLGYGLDEEVLRVLAKMPDWTPGMEYGKPVNVKLQLPVNFKLN